MKLFHAALLTVTSASLLACSTSESGGNVTSSQSNWNTYEEEAQAAELLAGDLSASTRVDDTPTQDTASMSGTFSATSAATSAIVGQMTMEADFGAGTVSGELYNTFVDHGSTHDPLTGTLSYDGTVVIDPGETDSGSVNGVTPDNTDIDAHGEESLTTVDGDTYNLFLDLFGDVHEIAGADPLTAVDGYLEGNVTITEAGTTNPLVYDLDGTYTVYEDE